METIGVIYGGKSCEHEVSVITALLVMAEIEDKYNVVPIYVCEKGWFTGELLKDAKAYKSFDENLHTKIFLDGKKVKTKGFLGITKTINVIDVCLNCMHGGMGESGGYSGLFEINDIPYTSCNLLSSAVCMDKEYFKIIAKSKGFKVVSGTTVGKNDLTQSKTLDRIIKKYGESLVVKPVDSGSSIGVSAVNNKTELKKGIELALLYSDRAIVEKKISPLIEYNCAGIKIGGEIIVSAIEKPKTKGEILSYQDKYLQKEKIKPEYKPKTLTYSLANKIRKTTAKLYKEFNLSGVVRVDYIYDEASNVLYVNEVNTIPGSLAMGLFKECSIDCATLCDALIDEAKERQMQNQKIIKRYSSELLSGEYTVSKS